MRVYSGNFGQYVNDVQKIFTYNTDANAAITLC